MLTSHLTALKSHPESATLKRPGDVIAHSLLTFNCFACHARNQVGVPLAKLASPSQAWPEGTGKDLGFRFTGYRLSPDKRPTFLYEFGGLFIQDTPNPVESDTEKELIRELRFSGSAVENLWFRAARASTIKVDDDWYRFDGLQMRVESTNSAKPLIRQQGDAAELLLPVSASTVMTLRFRW